MPNVLVVDDTKNIRVLLTTCLEIEGYHVRSVSDGNQALQLLETESFDLIFLDIKLPEYSGTEVLRRMRAGGIETPVIIMTAFATVKNAVECTKLGAVAYLQKPFSAEKIRQVLEEVKKELGKEFPEQIESLKFAAELILTGRPDQALATLKRMLSTHPLCGETYLLLGKAYEAQGNRSEADKAYAVAKQLTN